MSNVSPMYITDVFGALCEDIHTMVYLDKYIYILELDTKMYVTREGMSLEKVTFVEPNIIYTTDPDGYKQYSIRKRSITFKYEDLYAIIRDNYGDAILHNGVITNCIYEPEKILDKLNIYNAEFADLFSFDIDDGKRAAFFNKIKIDHKVDKSGLYVFIKDQKFYNIDVIKVERIIDSLNSLRGKDLL